jgi:hypothetical protein
MNHPDAKSPLKVRPSVLLWTLLVVNVAGVVACLVAARKFEREASVILTREPQLRAKADQNKARIKSETDVESLRSVALRSCDRPIQEWHDQGDWCQRLNRGFVLASVGAAIMSVILAYALYGLRVERRTANQHLQPTPR